MEPLKRLTSTERDLCEALHTEDSPKEKNMIFFFFALLSGILVVIFITTICIRMFLLVITVQYSSMSPTLEHGDRVIAIRRLPKSWLRKGQIVLIWPLPGVRLPVPADYQEPPYIKRIIAVSGETF